MCIFNYAMDEAIKSIRETYKSVCMNMVAKVARVLSKVHRHSMKESLCAVCAVCSVLCSQYSGIERRHEANRLRGRTV